MNDALELWYPVKPYGLNQPFGADPDYYKKFKDRNGNPEKGHMGVDLLAAHATPLYAPVAGEAWYDGPDAHGGDGIYIRTQSGDGKWYNVILWHLCSKDDPEYHPTIPTDGSHVKVALGQLIGYTDNSGAPYESSGDHLHLGLIETTPGNVALNPDNGFNGCIDPMPFFNGYFAQGSTTILDILKAEVSLLTKVVWLLTLLKK